MVDERRKNKYLLNYIFVIAIIIPIVLSIIYSYTSDFQPQGRYIMGIIVPFTYFVVKEFHIIHIHYGFDSTFFLLFV